MRIARCVSFAAFFAESFDAHILQKCLSSARPTPVSAPHPVQNATLRAFQFTIIIIECGVIQKVRANSL